MFSQTLGGIPLLLEVMREHKGSEEIARVGFLAVWYLTRNEDIQKIIGESGEIPLLLEMLGEHGVRNAEVAKQGCGALMNLAANNADNKSKILAANGVSMVERMKSTWASNEGVQTNANGALRNLR